MSKKFKRVKPLRKLSRKRRKVMTARISAAFDRIIQRVFSNPEYKEKMRALYDPYSLMDLPPMPKISGDEKYSWISKNDKSV